jgi:hypothetical protein
VMAVAVREEVRRNVLANRFVEKYSELIPHSQQIGVLVNSVRALQPTWTDEQVMDEGVRLYRLTNNQPAPVVPTSASTPTLAPTVAQPTVPLKSVPAFANVAGPREPSGGGDVKLTPQQEAMVRMLANQGR